jgi:hypothetical protein
MQMHLSTSRFMRRAQALADCAPLRATAEEAGRDYDAQLLRRYGVAAFAPGAPRILNRPDEAEAYLQRYIAAWAASDSPYAYSRLVGLGSAAWAEAGDAEGGDDGSEDDDGSGSDGGRR